MLLNDGAKRVTKPRLFSDAVFHLFDGDGVMPEHLLKRASTIYGGTNEVQKNVIAKAVLGL